jgi:hypothetical protein
MIKGSKFLVAFFLLDFASIWAGPILSPPGTATVASFYLRVSQDDKSPKIPLRLLNGLQLGQKIQYEPLKLSAEQKEKGKVALILAPAQTGSLAVLRAQAAGKPAEWIVPFRTSLVALVFGPAGLDVKKVQMLVKDNQDIISQLADYATQSAQIEALIEALAAWEKSPAGTHDLHAALDGFSSRYGVALPQINPHASTDQQAYTLLSGVLPVLSSYDPLSPQRDMVMQQSASLAASVAGVFFGTPAGLAVGGVALFQNLRTMIFPGTDFRPAIPQNLDNDGIALCSKAQAYRARTRQAFLWASRFSNASPPVLSLVENQHIPLGIKSPLEFKSFNPAQRTALARLRDWRLTGGPGAQTIPVKIEIQEKIFLDLNSEALPPGQYRLSAYWDWTPIQCEGLLDLHPLTNLAETIIRPESADSLVEGAGLVDLAILGPDFQFIDKITLSKTERYGQNERELPYRLPKGRKGGEQREMAIGVNTSQLGAGEYKLTLHQVDGRSNSMPVAIHPPNPQLSNLPLRANLGDSAQTLLLKGTRLERIVKIICPEADFVLESPLPKEQSERRVQISLKPGVKLGTRLGIDLEISGLNHPISIPEALEIAPPRPRMVKIDRSLPSLSTPDLRQGELPAGVQVNFAIQAENTDKSTTMELFAENSTSASPLILKPGERHQGMKFDAAGRGLFFLSIDPGAICQPGSPLTAQLVSERVGASDSISLGKVILFPHIGQLSLTEDKISDDLYLGTLTGEDLQVIEKTGWDARNGYSVQGIPTPNDDEPQRQTLKILLPWPPPSPHAPLYIWLRGEADGRLTNVKY